MFAAETQLIQRLVTRVCVDMDSMRSDQDFGSSSHLFMVWRWMITGILLQGVLPVSAISDSGFHNLSERGAVQYFTPLPTTCAVRYLRQKLPNVRCHCICPTRCAKSSLIGGAGYKTGRLWRQRFLRFATPHGRQIARLVSCLTATPIRSFHYSPDYGW